MASQRLVQLFFVFPSLTFIDVGFDLVCTSAKLLAHLSRHINRVDVHTEISLAPLELVKLLFYCLVIVLQLFIYRSFFVIGLLLEFEFLECAATSLLFILTTIFLVKTIIIILTTFVNCRGIH